MESVVIRHSDFPAAFCYIPCDSRELVHILKAMLEALQTSSYALRFIELSLVDDSAQGVLNRDFLGVPGPTNILSFPDGETGSLSLDVFAYLREALLYGQEPRAYLIRLLAHGVAHLCGLDHGEEMERLCYILEKAAREKSLTGGRR